MSLKMLAKEVLSRSVFRNYLFPSYRYNFSPQQLSFLCSCIDETQVVDGSIIEVGCSDGTTTVYLNVFMSNGGLEKTYYAIDTFSGFVERDIEFEVIERGKREEEFSGFTTNRLKWFNSTMDRNGISRVNGIRADLHKFEFETVSPFSFVLLDVDLYKPTMKSLTDIYELVSPGGIIVVDDCTESDPRWDGAFQAYREFTEGIGYSEEVLFDKLGVIRIPWQRVP